MQDDQSYDTVQDFMTPNYDGEQTSEDLHATKDLNVPLSSDAWTPSFVYDETESEPTPGQSGYGSVDTSSEDVGTPNPILGECLVKPVLWQSENLGSRFLL